MIAICRNCGDRFDTGAELAATSRARPKRPTTYDLHEMVYQLALAVRRGARQRQVQRAEPRMPWIAPCAPS